ncbi:MAG TPA: hypothetical protein VIM60_06975 [Edaphobacter sp.]
MQLVERIAESEHFQKSSRLPALLRHLALCTLRNDRSGLTEQAIGRAVFEKSSDFHPAEDSSVRVFMRQLRLRLHEYYQGPGAGENIVIEIPKGGYVLAFHQLQPAETPGTVEVPRDLNTSFWRQSQPWIPWVLLILSLLFAAAGWYRVSTLRKMSSIAWPLDQMIKSGQQTTMVLADVSYNLRLLGDREITLDEYVDHHYADRLIPQDAQPGELRLLRYLQSSQITSMADARAAFAVSALAGALRENIVIRSAKELNGNMLANGNFIFIGAHTSNPWVSLYQEKLNYRIVDSGTSARRYVQNRSPRSGEQEAYVITESTGHSGDDYAIIALVPGIGQQGDALLLQGIRLEGTEAAIQFLSNVDNRNEVMQRLKGANGGTLPHYFEVLLHAHSVGGSPTSVDCIAARPWTKAKS